MKRMFAVVIIIGVLAAAVPSFAQEAINIARAEAIVTQTYAGVTIVSIQRSQQNNIAVWEARLADGSIVYVNAQTGEITGRVQAPTGPALPAAQPAPALSAATAQGLPPVGFTQALDIALAQYPGTLLIKAELEPRERTRGMGPLTWDLKLSNGMAVYVDATTGAVVEVEPWGGRRGPSGTPVGTPAVSFEQAVSAAQALYPNLTFREVKLEQAGRREGYAVVWRIEYGRGATVMIDANSGVVLRAR